AANADTNRGAALRAGIVSGEIARPKPRHRCIDAPGERRFVGDAEIDAHLADGCDVTIVRRAIDTEHAAEIGDGTHHEADACAAAAFKDTYLDPLHGLLRMRAGERRDQRHRGARQNCKTAHDKNSGLKGVMQKKTATIMAPTF